MPQGYRKDGSKLGFQKGNQVWRSRKINVGVKGLTPWNKGKTDVYSEDSLRKMSESQKLSLLKRPHPRGMLGKKHTEEMKKLMSENHKAKNLKPPCVPLFGEENPNWRGGLSTERELLGSRKEYRNWRTAVFERDDYSCQECGRRGGQLEADHIKPFAYYPESRYQISNGRTLCKECHKETDTYLWKALKFRPKNLILQPL